MNIKANFRYILFLSACLVIFSAETLTQNNDTVKILFIGNSYTYTNDLPGVFTLLSSSGGHIVYTEESDPGGFQLQFHETYQPTLDKIKERAWTYIVLQEQSQIPSIDYLRYTSMYPAARVLDSLIRQNGAATVFYMTWGRRLGGQQCVNSYCSPVFSDFYHMQDSLKSAYSEIASLLNAKLAPAGEGWRAALNMNHNIDLWDIDDSHPSLKGTYLTACVFYETLFNQSPVGLTYTAGLSLQDALFLQTAAASLLTEIEPLNSTAGEFSLYQNYPNPFNPNTLIKFTLGKPAFVNLSVYDITGRLVMNPLNSYLTSSEYKININAANLPSGIYLYKIRLGYNGTKSSEQTLSRKMILIK